jgi:hypothetical protein
MEITLESGDDPDFIVLVQAFLQRLAEQARPEALCMTKIDNWFDHKWFRFYHGLWKGKGEQLGLPPFSSKRRVSHTDYLLEGTQYRACCTPECAIWACRKSRRVWVTR